jgi:fluoride exporter
MLKINFYKDLNLHAMDKYIFIFLGGGAGSIMRYLVSGWSFRAFGSHFPYGTFTVNLLGSLLVGILWALSEDFLRLTPNARNFVFIGLLGGFTTFSTYTLETLNLIRGGEYLKATGNVLSINIFGLLMVLVGFAAARYLLKVR